MARSTLRGVPWNPRVFGRTAAERAYDLRRAAQKRNKQADRRNRQALARDKRMQRRGGQVGCVVPVVALLGLVLPACR